MQPAVKLEYDDYLLFPDDGLRHELIDGEHEVTPAPNRRHQEILQRLNHLLYSFVAGSGRGRVYFAPFEVRLSNVDVVQPDLVYVSTSAERWLTDAGIGGPPSLVVEVLSPTTRRRDEFLKLKLYERFGVDEYWTVDPETQTVVVHRLEKGRYREPLRVASPDRLLSPQFPGLEIALTAIFD